MRFTIDRARLLEACSLVSIAVPSRTTVPVYQCLKLTVAGDELSITGTDLETGIKIVVPCEPGELHASPGSVAIPAARLASILRSSDADAVRLSVDPRGEASIVVGFAEYDLPTEVASSFADLPAFPDQPDIVLPFESLRKMAGLVAFAAAKDEGKYAMRGVHFEAEPDVLTLVATDGKRLAVAHGQAKCSAASKSLVPPKAIALLQKVEAAGDVQIAVHKNHVIFKAAGVLIYSRLVEGQFPPFRQVIPKKYAHRLDIDPGAMLAAIRQAAVMTDEESKRVAFEFGPSALTLAAQGATSGKSKVKLAMDGPPKTLAISFDPAYLVEVLRVLGAGSTLDLIDGQKPAVFRDGEDYLYLVVPLT